MPQIAGKILTAKECRLIEAALVNRKIGKAEASRRLRKYEGYLYGVLVGKHNPSDAQLKAIAKLLGLRFVASVPARIEYRVRARKNPADRNRRGRATLGG